MYQFSRRCLLGRGQTEPFHVGASFEVAADNCETLAPSVLMQGGGYAKKGG